jgi:hypothetical protein
MQLANDIDFPSGDWAGNVWSSSGIPGQDQSCAQRTGFSTCEAFVQASGASFSEACKSIRFHRYSQVPICPVDWEVTSVKIYQQS